MMLGGQNKERGAVLLTTLLLLTVMAAITVAIMDDILFSVRRTTNIEAAEQSDWYGRGGEEYAKTWIVKTMTSNEQAINHVVAAQAPLTLPIDNGEFRLLLEDGRNCFNVNQFSNEKQVKTIRNRLTFLLVNLDFDEQDASIIAARIQDWIDVDALAEPGGAEEFTYLNKTPPYHPANTAMVDITELRAIEGIDEETFERISPFLCAMDDAQNNKLNLNSLRFEQAPLLAEVFGVDNGLKVAQAVIAARPPNGYDSIDKVWQSPFIEVLELKGAGKDKVELKTDRIIVNLQVDYSGQIRAKAILYAVGKTDAQILARRGMF